MLMQYVAMFGKLPFKPGIPNEETIAAMEEAEHPENLRKGSLAFKHAHLSYEK
jgi:antitoxin component of RelBE/YafQ-DinJ toxin-antitoxin module